MKYLLHLSVIYQLIFLILVVLIIGLFLSQHTTYYPVLLIVYILFFICFGYWSLQFAFKKNIAQKSIKADIDTRDSKLDFNLSYIPLLGFVVIFGLICHQLFLYDNSLFVKNSSIIANSPFDCAWMLYAIDNFIRSVLFDFLETYHFKISQIDSNNNLILTFVFIFKSTLSIFFIKALFNLIKATKKIENQNK